MFILIHKCGSHLGTPEWKTHLLSKSFEPLETSEKHRDFMIPIRSFSCKESTVEDARVFEVSYDSGSVS